MQSVTVSLQTEAWRRCSDGKLSWLHRWRLVRCVRLSDRRGSRGLAGVECQQDGKKQVNKQKERENKMGRPTEKMTDFAEKISDLLGVKPDDWDDFESVSEFISEYKEDYFDALRDNK